MSSVKWIKINIDMFDDEKIKIIQAMPEGDSLLVVWIKLITLAGKTNDGGYIYIAENMPYTEEMLSTIMNKPINTIRLALSTFLSLKMIEEDTKGIYLINFEKHQSLDKMEKIKEQNRIRVAKYRDKKKQELLECNDDVTLHVMQSNGIDIDIDKDIDKDNNIYIPFGEYKRVKLKQKEYDKLIEEYGKEYVDFIIDRLDEYVESNNNKNKYKNFNLVIRKAIRENWFKKDKELNPEWFNKKVEKKETTEDERLEIESLLEEYR
ncbi:MAG: phage replisome organizer N-terminal domain-containing protein [Clostridium sp.]|nr:phage replisome organizer N-terminal domain-containing protein [Clostridium sp.]